MIHKKCGKELPSTQRRQRADGGYRVQAWCGHCQAQVHLHFEPFSAEERRADSMDLLPVEFFRAVIRENRRDWNPKRARK